MFLGPVHISPGCPMNEETTYLKAGVSYLNRLIFSLWHFIWVWVRIKDGSLSACGHVFSRAWLARFVVTLSLIGHFEGGRGLRWVKSSSVPRDVRGFSSPNPFPPLLGHGRIEEEEVVHHMLTAACLTAQEVVRNFQFFPYIYVKQEQNNCHEGTEMSFISFRAYMSLTIFL